MERKDEKSKKETQKRIVKKEKRKIIKYILEVTFIKSYKLTNKIKKFY